MKRKVYRIKKMETVLEQNMKEVVEERVRASFCPNKANLALGACYAQSHSLIEIHEAYENETHIINHFKRRIEA
jgi:hypothetical protein